MKATFWGTRGSLASPGLDTIRYGGNTSCVEVRTHGGDLIVLDAGTGIRRLGRRSVRRLPSRCSCHTSTWITSSGLGFFAGLFHPGWTCTSGDRPRPCCRSGPGSPVPVPPLFPVRLRDLPCRLTLHDVPLGTFEVPGFR